MNRFVQIRLKAGVHHIDLGRRVLSHHGLFGNLHVVTADTALRLVDEGLAKLRPGQSLSALRHAVAHMSCWPPPGTRGLNCGISAAETLARTAAADAMVSA